VRTLGVKPKTLLFNYYLLIKLSFYKIKVQLHKREVNLAIKRYKEEKVNRFRN